MVYNIISFFISLLIPIYIVLSKKDKGNKERYIIYAIIVIGCIVRLFNIQNMPNGLNVDEASAGYEAYSILNWGVDRHNNTNPVYLVAWGSGQNVLYTYLMIPFIKVLGLSELSVRLPMAIMGCISLIIFYELLKNNFNKKMCIVGTAFFAICPWHIMKSRWGLESNLFPELLLISIYFINLYLKNNKSYNWYIASVFLGISAYAYGTSYFFLPVFEIISLLFMIHTKKITIKQAVIFFMITFVITLPLIVFVIINTFDLPKIDLGILTIPRLSVNRYEEMTSIFSGNFLVTSINNFIQAIKILVYQYDNLGWNAQYFFGMTYVFSLPMTLIGLVKDIKNTDKTMLTKIINIWGIVSVLLLFVCEPNINRINIIFYPIIYYTIIGIEEIVKQNKIIEKVIVGIYSVSFVFFLHAYHNIDFNKYQVFEPSMKAVFEEIDDKENKKIYISNNIKEPYIYTLFYAQSNVNEFINTVDYVTTTVEFNPVRSFNNYYFYIPEELEENAVCIIKKEEKQLYNFEEYKIKEIGEFVLIENKEG